MIVDRNRVAATLDDVARAAGVSLATASRALNGSARKVNAENRQRVLAAAAALSYSPNLAAQTVARGGTSTVALVVADIADQYFSSIAAGVMRTAEEHDLVVTIGTTERRSDRETQLVRILRRQRPRSIILVGSRPADQSDRELIAELEAYERGGGRVTLVSQPSLPFRTVQIMNREGAAALAERLIGLGYRSAAVLTGTPGLLTARERVQGFADVFAAHGHPIEDRCLLPSDFTRDGGFVAAGELLRRGLGSIDVVFAVNDVMAVGAMAYLRSTGVRLPEDIAVAGFDDIPSLRDITPAMTTVSLPLEEIGRRAVELALDEDADPGDPGADRRIGDRAGEYAVPGRVALRNSSPVDARESEGLTSILRR